MLAFDSGAHAFGLSEPRGMLVCGVQGCGKSLVSKATARVLALPLVRLDFAEVFAAASPEHAIHEATRAVEAVAPVVLWVDEIEKGLGADANDARQVRVFGAFLTWLQERQAPVFVSATANDVERLPPELARRGRFDEVFFVDLPSTKERAQILGVHLKRRGRDPGAIRSRSSTRELEHWSGAEIEQMVSSAPLPRVRREAPADRGPPARGGAGARPAGDAVRGEDPGAAAVGSDAGAPGFGGPADARSLRGLNPTFSIHAANLKPNRVQAATMAAGSSRKHQETASKPR